MNPLCIVIIGLSMLFNACSSEAVRVVPCKIEKPLKPHRADFKDNFDYLKAIFKYTYDLESSLEVCE